MIQTVRRVPKGNSMRLHVEHCHLHELKPKLLNREYIGENIGDYYRAKGNSRSLDCISDAPYQPEGAYKEESLKRRGPEKKDFSLGFRV